jgi:hypothetical protein
MLFRHIQISDFLSFKGINTFDFPDPEKSDHALMLVLAPNTAGKTNIIRSLRFLFCGELLGHSTDPHKLINDAAMSAAPTGSTVDAWVQAKIIYRDRERTIRRRITAKCIREGSLVHRETILEEQQHERKGDIFISDQGEIQRALNLMVPPELFDYFFFEGETLANHLVGGRDTKGIREGLATLIHEHEWEDAVQTVRSVQTQAAKELRKLADANREYEAVVNRLEANREQLTSSAKAKADRQSEKEEAVAAYETCEAAILDLSQGKSFEVLNEKLATARSSLKAKKKEFEAGERSISRSAGSSLGLPFFTKAYGPALGQLKSMRDQNLLPADVSEGFVNRLLDWPKSKSCICGRSLDPASHRTERECIEDYRERTMAVDLNHALLSLLNSLETSSQLGFISRMNSSRSTIAALLLQRDHDVVAIRDLESRVTGLEDERERLNVEEIQRLQSKQKEASHAMVVVAKKIVEVDQQIRMLEHKRAELDIEVRALKRSGAGNQIATLVSGQSRAAELIQFIESARASVRSAFHSQLQAFVSQYYDVVAPDGSTAWVDPNTLLPAIRVGGEIRRNIGGAQRQLLVLSHIVSLAQLRKWLHEQLQELQLAPGRIDDHCFVLDSVFGPTADEFREKCAEFLVGKARQIIVLVASQQWDEIVRSRLEKAATKVYRLVRNTPKQDINPSERTMLFRGKEYHVFEQIPENEKAFTIAKEIRL